LEPSRQVKRSEISTEKVKRRLDPSAERVTDDGIEILPTERFIEMLWQGYIW
jgi:hypothetical protein